MRTTTTTAVAVALAVVLASAGAAPVAAYNWSTDTTETDAATQTTSETYSGTHVSFTTSGNAVTDYSVDGATMLSSVETESESSYESRTGASLSLDLTAVTSLEAAGLSLDSQTEAGATVTAESGATLSAHDNGHGIVVVESGGDSQLVKAEVASGGNANAESENRVVVTTESGETGTFLVAGEGTVDVNSEGDVVAKVSSGGKLVFRAYAGSERGEAEQTQEQLIANGTATGEVYVMADEGGDTVVDTVRYGGDTTISANQTAANEVNVTIERTKSQGKVLITQVSEAAVGSTDSLSVAVDGQAAAEASTYGELVAATNDEGTSKYMVRQTSSMQAEGQAQVLVGVNHFSERTITMSGSDDGSSGGDGTQTVDGTSTDDEENEGSTATGAPGVGVAAALLALLAAAAVATRRD
jgi:PGF-CTERM protein